MQKKSRKLELHSQNKFENALSIVMYPPYASKRGIIHTCTM